MAPASGTRPACCVPRKEVGPTTDEAKSKHLPACLHPSIQPFHCVLEEGTRTRRRTSFSHATTDQQEEPKVRSIPDRQSLSQSGRLTSAYCFLKEAHYFKHFTLTTVTEVDHRMHMAKAAPFPVFVYDNIFPCDSILKQCMLEANYPTQFTFHLEQLPTSFTKSTPDKKLFE